MTITRFLLGIALSFFALVPVGFGASAMRLWLLPHWQGAEARLVEIVLALSTIVVIAEALGTFGWFRSESLAIALAIVGGGAWFVARRLAPDHGPTASDPAPKTTRSLPPWTLAVGAAGVLVVVGSWLSRTIDSIQHGISTTDSLWYHLPIAARFVQTGHTNLIQFFDTDPVTAYFPASSSLFHAIGILFFRTDLVSTVVDLGWLALALGAGWAAGKAFGVAPAATLGVALLLATPGLVATQAGGAYDDIAGIALLLTAVALAVTHRDEPRSIVHEAAIGLAAGLCVGMKFTFIAPAVLLCLGLVVTAPRGARIRHTITLLLTATVTGGYWYVRNAVATGNPLPSLAGFGPLKLPSVKGALPTSSVSKFLFDGTAWRANFLPGLRSSFGPAWIPFVLLAFAGVVTAIAQRHEPFVRMLGIVGLLSFVAYVVSPQYLIGGFGRPFYFGVNLRYAAPGLVIGLVLLPIALRRWWIWVLGLYAITIAVTQIDPTSWPTGFGWGVFQDRVSGGDAAWAAGVLVVGVGLTVAAVWGWRHLPALRARRWIVAVAVPLVVLLGLTAVHDTYIDNRYTDTIPFRGLYNWARDVHHARIAVIGLFMQDQYPVAGLDITNHVQFAGVETSDGGFRPPRTCQEWVNILESGRYQYVVIAPSKHYATWTTTQPDARVAYPATATRGSPALVTVYRIDPNRTARSC